MKNILLASCFAVAIAPAAMASQWVIGSEIDLEHMDTKTQGRGLTFVYNGGAAVTAPKYTSGPTSFGIAGMNYFDYCNPSRPGQVKGFCVEAEQGFSRGVCIKYTIEDYKDVPKNNPPGTIGTNSNRVALIGDLYARHYSFATDMSGGFEDFKNRVAGFQLAIWEISHEDLTGSPTQAVGELNLERGAFQVVTMQSTEAMNYAMQFMSTLGDGGQFKTFSGLFGLSNSDYQDVLVVVPSPAIAGLAGLGLIGLRRRRR